MSQQIIWNDGLTSRLIGLVYQGFIGESISEEMGISLGAIYSELRRMGASLDNIRTARRRGVSLEKITGELLAEKETRRNTNKGKKVEDTQKLNNQGLMLQIIKQQNELLGASATFQEIFNTQPQLSLIKD